MPFQVILSSFSQLTCTEFLFSAGEDQAAICATTVTLTATVTGDLTGHTVFWEQVSGNTSIIYTTPQNQLIVMYTTAIFVDRVFRFYIDKGTLCEQSDDVTIFGTPTSITYVNNAGSGGAGQVGQILGDYTLASPRGRNPTLFPLRFFPAGYSGSGGGGCSAIQFAISWTEPELSQFLTRYVVQQLVGSVFVDIASLPVTPRVYYSVVLGGIYRVLAEFNNAQYGMSGGSFLSLHPSNSVFLTTDPRIESADIEGFSPTMPSGFSNLINSVRLNNYTVTFITVRSCDNFAVLPDTNASAFAGRTENVKLTNYSAVLLTLIQCDNFAVLSETNAGAFAGRTNSVKLTNYVVQPLGGGSIGG